MDITELLNTPSNCPGPLTVGQVAALLQVSEGKVFALLRSGDLESVKLGRCTRVTADAVRRYVDHLVGRGSPA